MRNRLRALCVASSVAILATLGVATPAQAFAPFTYTAACPGDATGQTLTVRNFSGSAIAVQNLGTAPASASGGVTVFPELYYDTVRYDFTGPGNLDWYYDVKCFYRTTPYNVGAWWGYQQAFDLYLVSDKYPIAALPPGYVAQPDADWTHIVFNPRQCIIFDQPEGGVNRETAYTLCNYDRTQKWVVQFGIPGVWGLWSDGFLPDDVN